MLPDRVSNVPVMVMETFLGYPCSSCPGTFTQLSAMASYHCLWHPLKYMILPNVRCH